MDQWYYNRLSNASASFQTGSGTSASDYHQQLAGHQTAGNGGTTSSSTSQLLLQAAHGQSLTPTPFNAGFLTSPYDFPPLFSNASKNSAYVSPHRALTSAVASNKPPLENELSALRENYNPAHHSNLSPAGTSFSDHLNSSGPIGWPHQASTQLPFGVLPHESVGASSTGTSMKTGPSDYAFYSSSQHLSQLADYKTSSSYSDMKSSGIYADAKRGNRSVSPVIPSKTTATISSTLLYHGSASTPGSYPVPAHSPPRDFTSTNKQEGSSSVQQSQSCVVSTASAHQLSKDYGVQQSSTQSCSTPVYRDTSANREKHERSSYVPPTVKSSQPHLSNPAKGQSKVFLDQGNTSESSRRAETTLDSNQSSPISYSMVDVSLPHRYTAERSDTASSSKHLVSTNHNQQEGSQAVIQSYPQALNHQAASYRLFSNQSGLTEVDYHRAKPTPSIDATYNTTQQDGSDSASTQKKTSPHVSHSQPSPIGLVQNPAYLLYNSPMAPMASPSPLQHTESANSCHPGTSSPFKPSNQLVATAPLNVSTTRPETVQSQTVGYPSVITRTSDPLSKPTPYDNTRAYERNHETAVYGKHCWDATNERQSEAHQQIASSHQRKYQTVETSIASFNHSDVCTNISIQQQSLKTTDNSSERQHSYYDHSAVSTASSQDISSCRGDPMSIVKNLQSQQQQACQVPSSSDEAKSRCKKLDSGSGSSYNSNKRRKSSEKQVHVPNSTDYFNGRVPPPAHHNVSSQQQQGGSYFSNYLSTVPTSRAYNSSQATFHPSPTTLIGNQHQSLYMSPFSFPPLSLAGSTPTNSGSCPLASSTTAPSTFTPNATVPSTLVPSITAPSLFVPSTTALRTLVPNITSLSTTTPSSHVSSATTQSTPVPPTSNEFRSSSAHLQPEYSESDSPTNMAISSQLPEEIQKPVERSSKPIIPDIEEELSFLASVGPVMMIKSEQGKKNSIASGFEASYLKFLQGEREVSPPPNNRNNRRVAWVNTSSLEPPKPVVTRTPSTKGGPGSMVIPSTRISNMKDKSASCDPENDPRYFPLPKNNAQRKSLDSSDSEPDFGSKNPTTKSSKTTTSKTQESKPMAAVAPRTAIKQSSKPSIVNNHQPGKRGRKKKLEVPVPRRETSKRKAKEKGSILLGGDDDDPDEFGDSDSDPAWTPVASKPRTLSANIDSSDDDAIKKKNYKKGLKYTPAARKRLKQPYSDDEEDNSSENDKRKKRTSGIRRRSLNTQGSSGKSHSLRSIDDVQAEGDDLDTHPFKIGEFVVLIADLEEKWPVIWRVDGKTLLEKFAPYEEECETLYRNISTYSGWSPQNYQIYCSAPVKFRVNTKTETVVEFLRHEMTEEDDDILEALIKETMKFQDNFEVYIQTLISQALDSNFLTEIFQEHDEYFLSNVKTVDVIVDDRRKRFLQVVNWRPELEASIATWPCYNVMFELVGDEFRKNCAACDKPIVSARVLLYGQPYNSTTLEGCQPDPKLVSEKDFLTCRLCLKRIELYNKVAHQKYLMYIECAKRVNDRRLKDPSKDTTEILNELLADEKWLNELFYNVRMTWAKIDRLEQSATKQ